MTAMRPNVGRSSCIDKSTKAANRRDGGNAECFQIDTLVVPVAAGTEFTKTA